MPMILLTPKATLLATTLMAVHQLVACAPQYKLYNGGCSFGPRYYDTSVKAQGKDSYVFMRQVLWITF